MLQECFIVGATDKAIIALVEEMLI